MLSHTTQMRAMHAPTKSINVLTAVIQTISHANPPAKKGIGHAYGIVVGDAGLITLPSWIEAS